MASLLSTTTDRGAIGWIDRTTSNLLVPPRSRTCDRCLTERALCIHGRSFVDCGRHLYSTRPTIAESYASPTREANARSIQLIEPYLHWYNLVVYGNTLPSWPRETMLHRLFDIYRSESMRLLRTSHPTKRFGSRPIMIQRPMDRSTYSIRMYRQGH